MDQWINGINGSMGSMDQWINEINGVIGSMGSMDQEHKRFIEMLVDTASSVLA